MNPNHDSKTGEFSSGGGGGAKDSHRRMDALTETAHDSLSTSLHGTKFELLTRVNAHRARHSHMPFSRYDFSSAKEIKAVLKKIEMSAPGHDPWRHGFGPRD